MSGNIETLLMMGRRCAALLSFALLMVPYSASQTSSEPMTFEWGEVFGLHRVVFANGDLTPETPAAFKAFLDRSEVVPATRLFLNSNGGDLQAGIQLGQIIRAAKLNTAVGRNGHDRTNAAPGAKNAPVSYRPGQCVSACTLAFLGGISREVDSPSIYAVHQVSMDCVDRALSRNEFPWLPLPGVNYCPDLNDALSLVQVASGAVVEYVRSMGADPIFLTEMSRAGPDSVNALTSSELASYRITHSPRTVAWEFETNEKGEFFLRHTQSDPWKEHRVEFFCVKNGSADVAMWIVHDTRRNQGRINAKSIVDNGATLSAEWQDSDSALTTDAAATSDAAASGATTLDGSAIIEPLAITEFENLSVTIALDPMLLENLLLSKSFVVVARPKGDQLRAPFELIAIEPDTGKIAGLARSCR